MFALDGKCFGRGMSGHGTPAFGAKREALNRVFLFFVFSLEMERQLK